MLTQGYSENAPWNDSHWKHPRFNELLKMARVEFDETKRHEMYIEMQSLIRDEGGVVVPVFSDFLEAGTNKLKFDNLAGDVEMDGMRCAERWWFES
jgi:peptide/nickel transport system substrate-binding protein